MVLKDVSIHPRGRVAKDDPLDHLDVGLYFRALQDPNRVRVEAQRELAWMERHLGHGFHSSVHGNPVMPFALLAEHAPESRQRAARRALQGISPEQHLERYIPQAENAYRQIIAGERTLTSAATSAGAATGVLVDIANSIMWLTETGRALDMMTVVPGLQAQWQGYYGNVNPVADWTGEGGAITETTPTMVRLQRKPVTLGMYWNISSAQVYAADTPIAMIVERGCADVVVTRGMRAFLSGDDVGASFAEDTDSFEGLMNSGVAETDFGAVIADLGRDDLVDARRRLYADEVDLDNLGWILSTAVAEHLEELKMGTGNSSERYVYEYGMVNSGAQSVSARDTIHLGKTGVTAPAVLLDRSAAVALIWGAGIMFNSLRIPGDTEVGYDLQIQANFAMMNPKRAEIIKQA